MKSNKLKLIIKVLIPVVIIGGCIGVEKVLSKQGEKEFNKAVIVNSDDVSITEGSAIEIESKEVYGNVEGLNQNFGFVNDDEVLVSIGLSKEEFNKKYPDPIDKNDYELYDKFSNEMCGKMYLYNLRDFSKKALGVDARNICSDLIPNTNKYVYLSENKISISDLNTKSEIGSIDASIFGRDNNALEIGEKCMGRWSKDGKCFITYDDEDLIVYNVEEDSIKKIKVDKDNRHVGVMPSYYSENGEDIYYIGVKYNKNARIKGIYKVNINDENEKIEEVFNLPANDESANFDSYSGICEYDILDGGKKVIFMGTIKGVSGIYIYDTDDEKFYNVVPAGTKSENRGYLPMIWLSPDKSKIIYTNLVKKGDKEQWNLYAARINGNSLTDRVCIYEDLKLCGYDVTWSADSKKILFFTTDDYTEENYNRFANKNEINIITFK